MTAQISEIQIKKINILLDDLIGLVIVECLYLLLRQIPSAGVNLLNGMMGENGGRI